MKSYHPQIWTPHNSTMIQIHTIKKKRESGSITDSSRGLAQKIREIFAKNLRNICEIFAKYLRKICEKFVKNLQKICEKSKFTQNLRKIREKFENFE